MKKKTLLISLVLSLAMIMTSFSFAFADVPKDGIESLPTLTNEVDCENFALDLYHQASLVAGIVSITLLQH